MRNAAHIELLAQTIYLLAVSLVELVLIFIGNVADRLPFVHKRTQLRLAFLLGVGRYCFEALDNGTFLLEVLIFLGTL